MNKTTFKEITKDKKYLIKHKDIYIKYLENVIKILLTTINRKENLMNNLRT